MNLRPLLFLDIDGVIVTHASLMAVKGTRQHPERQFDPGCVARLNRVTAATHAGIVLSSTWRMLPGWRETLRAGGIEGEIHGQTGTVLKLSAPEGLRFLEIEDYLARHPGHVYAIVDDDRDFTEEQTRRLVRTDFEHGLTDEGAERLIGLLSEEEMACAG